jgi:uncharacterized protein YheU (UPF0270 family)
MRRYAALNLTPEIIREVIRSGKKTRLAKEKASATMHTKKGTIVVIFAEYPDHIAVITITKGGRRR